MRAKLVRQVGSVVISSFRRRAARLALLGATALGLCACAQTGLDTPFADARSADLDKPSGAQRVRLAEAGPAAIDANGVFTWDKVALPPSNPQTPPPSQTSTEFTRNYGLGAIHAEAGYAVGATGRGIIVGVVDTGFDTTAADMQGAYSSDSKDFYNRTETSEAGRHGVRVASVIAARYNGRGTIGVAYESTILALRADRPPSDGCTSDCVRLPDTATAQAIDYAVAHGARIINMSFGSEGGVSSTLRSAITRAAAAGVVFTASAGNDGLDQSEFPARLSVEPGVAGSLLSVGASGRSGQLATFSNRAGATAPSYIVAPGQDVVTDCGSDGSCWRVAGTSFAAPHVAGALALLLQYFPGLSGRDAISILLRTTTEIGDPGADSVYGSGVLNLTRAFQPVGTSSLALPGGGQMALPGQNIESALGAAFGNAMAIRGRLNTFISDDYNRLFQVDLAQGYRSRARTGVVASVPPPVRQVAEAFDLPAGTTLTLAAQTAMFPALEGDLSPARAFLRPEEPASASASVRLGSFGFSAWRGQGAVAAPEGLGGHNAFTTLAQPDRAVSGVWRAGSFAFSGEGGWAEQRTIASLTPVDASTYAAATAAYAGHGFILSVSAGALEEPRGALGSEFNPASPLSLAARTRFAAVGFDRPLGNLWLRAEASVGRTAGGGRLVDIDQAVSSSWRLALSGACRPDLLCSRFGLELAQPLRVERGEFHALLADTPASYDAPITFSERRFSAAPDSRELDLRINASTPLAAGVLRLEAAAAFNPAHQDGAADLGVSALWRTPF